MRPYFRLILRCPLSRTVNPRCNRPGPQVCSELLLGSEVFDAALTRGLAEPDGCLVRTVSREAGAARWLRHGVVVDHVSASARCRMRIWQTRWAGRPRPSRRHDMTGSRQGAHGGSRLSPLWVSRL